MILVWLRLLSFAGAVLSPGPLPDDGEGEPEPCGASEV